jgi:hypothetical protein
MGKGRGGRRGEEGYNRCGYRGGEEVRNRGEYVECEGRARAVGEVSVEMG